jgi:MFS family permease
LIAFVSEKKRQVEEAAEPPRLSLKPFNQQFKYLLLVILIFTLGNSSDAFLILRAKGLGISLALIPILWGVLHVVKSVSSAPAGAISDRLGRKRMILLGWLTYGLVYLGFAFARETYHAWVLFSVYGIYFGLTEGVEKALVSDLVQAELRGTAYGMYNFVIGIAALPASLIFGFLWQIFSPKVAFSFGAALAFIAMALFSTLISADHNWLKMS